ncbi:biotin--[acetyl-CoA-carboxylase] ligase [Frondihabitans cladoniiphilus]|uniref:biotin--[acetyl-CoA-carboxylase] ligase n=1 Tax=Frondihabitans cladoniiphilus TaxID=715785 RepID=UPI0031ED75BC
MPEHDADFPLTSTIAARFVHLGETGSTNTALVELAGDGAPDGTVLVADRQTAGRGRLGREWVAPPGSSLAASILVRPALRSGRVLPDAAWGWFPLLGGVALRRILAALLPERDILLKWPNDVQIRGLKVSGMLAELVVRDGAPDAVVLGMGLNLTIGREHLPTPTSTSLALEGLAGTAAELADLVLSRVVAEVRALVSDLVAADGDPAVADLVGVVSAECDTLGRRVRVELPSGDTLLGTASALDDQGRLVVRDEETGESVAVAAADVTHLRLA